MTEKRIGEVSLEMPELTVEMGRAVVKALNECPPAATAFLDDLDRCMAPVMAMRLFICLEMEWALRGRTWDPQWMVKPVEVREAA